MARSAQYSSTANAYENNVSAQYVKNTVSTDWAPLGTDTVSFSFLAPISDGSDSFYLSFINAYDDGDQIKKRVIGRYTNNITAFDTGYIEGDINNVSIPYNPNNGDLRIIAWVHRDDGGVITSANWTGGNFIITYNKVVSGTEIPQDWLVTTTQTVVNPLETYTTVISPTDNPNYDDLYDQLEIPNAVEVAVIYIFDLINDIMSLHYMTFIVCYSVIMALTAWFLH